MPLEFTGEAGNQSVNLGTFNVPAGLSTFSITAWVNPDTVGNPDEFVVVAKGNTTGNTAVYKLQMEDGGNGNVMRGIINSDVLDGVTGLSAGVWTFVGLTYDGANKRLYLNGVQDATDAQTGTVSQTADAVRIAAVFTGSSDRREWDGLLDDIRFYNRTLSANEMLTMFTLRGKDRIFNGMIDRWRMGERAPGQTATGAGSVRDAGSLPQNGTGVNAPVYRAGILTA